MIITATFFLIAMLVGAWLFGRKEAKEFAEVLRMKGCVPPKEYGLNQNRNPKNKVKYYV